ncbi:MAG TPA: trypsin-like peptidase domain-containing protein [Acidimicrobiales bacterium]|nr:trypsin-like peptidase domain-containing protein [Acidimicrobiales bacterium]
MSDTPEEPGDGDPGPDEGGAGPDGLESPQRGWIDPDDRLWRHPSEVAGDAGAGSAAGPGRPRESPILLNAPPKHRFRGAVMGLVGVVAVAAVVAWIVVLLSPASQHPTNGSASAGDTVAGGPITTLAGQQVPAVVQTAGRSMVELEATTTHGTVVLVGVAVAEGGLVATTAALLEGASHVAMVGADGKLESASVVASDADSGVALVDVPEDLPIAPFADEATVAGGASEYTLSYVPAGGAGAALHCTPGSVTSVGDAIGVGPAAGMPSITTSVPAPVSTTAGAVLVTAGGSVAGLLYEPASSGTTAAGGGTTFLPSQLVVGVANDLRSGDRVVPGWLGVKGTDAPSDGGAEVETVSPGSPAATKLESGQVVTAVNALPVHTMAELRARIYILPPGSAITLSVQESTGTQDVGVTLGRAS